MTAVGMLFQAWLIGNVTKTIAQATQVEDEHQLLMARVQDFMKAKYMPHSLCQQVLTHQQKKFESDRNFRIHEFVRCVEVTQVEVHVYVMFCNLTPLFPFISTLPPKLEYGMLHELYIKKLDRCPCFTGLPDLVMIELCRFITPCSVCFAFCSLRTLHFRWYEREHT